MINKELIDAIDEQASIDAKKYVRNFFREINGIFKSNFNIDEYSEKIYSLLKYEKYDDYKIKSGKCDKVIYRYLSNWEFKPEFSDVYNEAFKYIYERVSTVYDTEIRIARQKEQTGSMFYNYYVSQRDKRDMANEILVSAIRRDIKDDELNRFIVDYINMDRTKSFSTAKQEARKAEIEAIRSHKQLDVEDIKKLAIVGAIIFGICWISKVSYDIKQEKKEVEKNNKPTYSYSYKNTASQSEDYYGIYDLENNEYVLGGDDIAKL